MLPKFFYKTKKKRKRISGSYKTGPNKKGHGFRLSQMPVALQEEFATLKKRLTIGTGITVFVMVIVLLITGQHATPDFTILATALTAMCGLILYDIISRRLWEKIVTNQIKALTGNHDRLVREVARNRSDLSILKGGLAETAVAVEARGKNMVRSHSVEARMLETIIEQLSNLGELPRPEVQSGHDDSILELEIAPPPSRPPPLTELDEEMDPDFDKLSDAVVLQLIRFALRHDKLEVFIQPIMALPQRKPRMYEVFARIRAQPGTYVPASRYLGLAEREHLTPAIDNLLLLRCLQILRDKYNKNSKMPYALNISASTLHDTGFMGDLVSFLTEERDMAHRLIFELPQEELKNMDEALIPILDGLSQLGCRFSMDRVKDRRINIRHLKSRNIRFIKMNANWLMKEANIRGGIARINRLKKKLDEAGIDLIVEKIETEADMRELLDFNVHLGQGYLFGKPDSYASYRDKERRDELNVA